MTFFFDGFELNVDRADLRYDGVEISLEPQAFAFLCYLVEHNDRMVPKEEMVAQVWDGRFITDAAISTTLKAARRALNDDGTAQKYIRTVRGRGFRFVGDLVAGPVDSDAADTSPATVAVPEPPADDAKRIDTGKPSVAVLPFATLGDNATAAILADAVPHELIQALSRLRWIRIIARGSSFHFRDVSPDMAAIGQTLNVGYVLSGLIEAMGPRFILSVDLSDCRSGEILWGERFETTQEGIHEVRARIAAQVVSSLEVYIPLNEARAARLGVSENLDAWSNYHLGLQHMFRFTREENARATGFFERAVSLDPGFARAHAGLSFTRFQDAFVKYSADPEAARKEARAFAEKSLELDPLDPFSNFTMGRSFWLDGDLEASIEWLNRAISLSPNYAQGHYSLGFSKLLNGETDGALQAADTSFSLSPLDPLLYGMLGVRAMSNFASRDFENAARWAEKAARAPRAHFLISMIAAAAHELSGNHARAQEWAETVRRQRPDAARAHFFAAFPFQDAAVIADLDAALSKTGF